MKKFENYVANLNVLKRANEEDLNNEFVVGGIIDKFFIQFELGWKVLKELLKYEGCAAANSSSPREIIKESYKMYAYIDEDVWLAMLRDRNDMTHVYDGTQAKKLVTVILEKYIPAFVVLQENIEEQYKDVLESF